MALVSSFNPSPVDELVALAGRMPAVVTVEAHYVIGGLGSTVAEIVTDHGLEVAGSFGSVCGGTWPDRRAAGGICTPDTGGPGLGSRGGPADPAPLWPQRSGPLTRRRQIVGRPAGPPCGDQLGERAAGGVGQEHPGLDPGAEALVDPGE